MKIIYLKLENVAGLSVAKPRPVVEIDFTKCQHRIVLIQAANGYGKSTLISALQPFANVTALDERSSISFIIANKSGYKEIRYLDGEKIYVIKHYFKPSGDTHSVKSYFSLNGEELNENGNVGSFLALVETYFGLTPDMIRLVRLGSNVNSFVDLKPAERKYYIGRLINEIDFYLKIHRKASDDLRLTKLMLATNSSNLQACHVDDAKAESKLCLQLSRDIKVTTDHITELKVKLAELDRLMIKHDLADLKRQRDEARVSISNFERTEHEVMTAGLIGVKLVELSRELTEGTDKQLDMLSSSNAIKLSIDSDRRRIEQLRASVARITSDADITSLLSAIAEADRVINETDPTVKRFDPGVFRSEDASYLITRLTSLNQIGSMILSLGVKPLTLYLSLRDNGNSIDGYLKDQAKRRLNHLGESDVKRLVAEVFQGELIITPNCDDEYKDCPYYRFSRVLSELKDKADGELQDDDVLRYLKLVATNIDMITNETERLISANVPDGFKVGLSQQAFLGRLAAKLSLFSTGELQDYLTMIRGNEIYRSQLVNRDRLRLELKVYQSSGADRQLDEIAELEQDIARKLDSVSSYSGALAEQARLISEIERKVALVTSYVDVTRYRPIVASSLASTEKLLEPLETAAEHRSDLQHQLDQAQAELTTQTEQHVAAERKLDNYYRLMDEGKELSITFNKQTAMQKAVSTKKGIPLVYVNNYETKLRDLANNLLRIVYGDSLALMKFNITATEFEIPVSINGHTISDIRYTSQSEVALITIALSFAISYETNERYNIPLLDEIDGGLDDTNRTGFMKMLDNQLRVIQGEQCFIISHNLGQIMNLPMDVIQLSPNRATKLQNVIYEG